MTEPLRTRTIKETLAGNLALLPEADLFLPLLEQVDDDGFFPDRKKAYAALASLGYTPEQFFAWTRAYDEFNYFQLTVCELARIHEFWVERHG